MSRNRNRMRNASPDGSKFFAATIVRGSDSGIMERCVTGQGTDRELAKSPGLWRVGDISPDRSSGVPGRAATGSEVALRDRHGEGSPPAVGLADTVGRSQGADDPRKC
jgi:hypothetical protein